MCMFCKIAEKKMISNIIYEDKDLMAFLDNDPINEGHILLIPKKHFLDIDDLPEQLLHRLISTAKVIVKGIKNAYSPHGYSIMQNGGEFNDIGHFHIHIFPRYKNDGFSWTSS